MEKFYIVSNDSALGEKYLEYLETVNKITDLFRDFSVRNNIHTNSFYPTVTRLWIDPDPPYLNTKPYSINPTFDHEVFWSWARELSKNNYVYISELVAPKDFEIVWNRSTLVSIDAHNTKTRNECLFKWKG